MKIFTVLIIAVAFWLGMAEGDCTAAVVMLALFGPEIFERKKRYVRNKKR